jgi:hypothetical protein
LEKLLKKAKCYAARKEYLNIVLTEKIGENLQFTNDHKIGWFKTFLGKHFSPDLKQT